MNQYENNKQKLQNMFKNIILILIHTFTIIKLKNNSHTTLINVEILDILFIKIVQNKLNEIILSYLQLYYNDIKITKIIITKNKVEISNMLIFHENVLILFESVIIDIDIENIDLTKLQYSLELKDLLNNHISVKIDNIALFYA